MRGGSPEDICCSQRLEKSLAWFVQELLCAFHTTIP